MHAILVVLLAGLVTLGLTSQADKYKDFQELIESHNFTLLSYTVTTDDDYILTINRVVPKDFDESTYTESRQPVIVQHGLFNAANDFFFNSPFLEPKDNNSMCGDNFGFCLVITGRYDIWIPNSRGNGYSNGHLTLDSNDRDYWNFTFDQMAVYDEPAIISKIQNLTGYQKLGYIGFSQGCNIMFALLSLQPQYADIIQPFIAWAPPPYIGNMTSILKLLLPLSKPFQLLGGPFTFSNPDVSKILSPFCAVGAPKLDVTGTICAESWKMMTGETDHLNETRLSVVYFHFIPASISTWQMVHFGQLYEKNDFYRYDYGSEEENMKAYKAKKPPLYPLENIPEGYKIFIVHGKTDAYVDGKDVKRLIKKLEEGKVNVTDYEVPSSTWSHMDYIMGMDAGRLVHDKTIEFLDEFYGK